MDTGNLFKYWLANGEEKWKTAQSLMKSKRYADALFFCHLAIETDLKAAMVLKKKDYPPLIHDLAKLAFLAELPLSEIQMADLEEITTFNIRARYDDYKFSFYKKATKQYTEKYFDVAKNLRLWIRKKIQLKK